MGGRRLITAACSIFFDFIIDIMVGIKLMLYLGKFLRYLVILFDSLFYIGGFCFVGFEEILKLCDVV